MRPTIVLLASSFALLACTKAESTEGPSTISSSTSGRVVGATSASAAPSPDTKKTADAPASVAAAAAPFRVVESPTAADVPSTPVRGSANGRIFEPKAIVFEPEKKGWKMILADKAMEKPTDMLTPGAQAIHVSLNVTDLAPGKKITKTMKSGDGYFQIAKADDATKLTSWNTANSYYVEISEWNVKPYDEKAGVSQQAGTVSGKIYVAHKSGDPTGKRGFFDSGVAGTFTSVPARYRGEPKFEK